MDQTGNFPSRLLPTTFILLIHHYVVLTTAFIGKHGQWQLLKDNTGVVTMHMALTHENTVLIFDQTGSGPSNYRLRTRSNGQRCLGNRATDIRDSTCYAHSVEYHIATNTLRPLNIDSDPFCSSGSFLRNGTLLQTGGYADGYRRIRFFHPCSDGKCDWWTSRTKLSTNRWYASSQLLPGNYRDRVIVVGGQRMFSYEFVPKRASRETTFALPFLHQTYNKSQGGSNLYPFLHLTPHGHLFIFANRDSILFNYRKDQVVKTYPRMPGKGSRNYPGSGSSVILPLDHRERFQKVEVMVCGGGAEGAYTAAHRGKFLEGLRSCGRMVITGNTNQWKMEDMPHSRLLMDMVILPTGDVILINGARNGTAGWNRADSPAYSPFLYKPKKPLGQRFSVLKSSTIARMYHSSAILLPDGRVLVGGGNPNQRYTYHNVKYPTELRLQAFAPQYTDHRFHHVRPRNMSIVPSSSNTGNNNNNNNNNVGIIRYRQEFQVKFKLGSKLIGVVEFNAYSPPFTTHSVSMNQRMLKLRSRKIVRGNGGWVTAIVEAPPSPYVAPPGYYLLFAVNGDYPSTGQWINFGHA